MRSGDLRHRITVQVKSLVTDNIGGWSETWSTFATVSAAIWPVSAKERISGQQLAGEVTHRVRIRYLAGVIPSMRISFSGRTLQIISVINMEERGIQLDLLCSEVV